MCKDILLAIEVDGYTHLWEDTINKDQKKDKDLEDIGFKVLRFNDKEV
ncbi:MAG: endonuclease domain-containing protein [Bacteroidales bacterium]|nr:endonuclease domain-containing protein [Bacteroidales bacterium]